MKQFYNNLLHLNVFLSKCQFSIIFLDWFHTYICCQAQFYQIKTVNTLEKNHTSQICVVNIFYSWRFQPVRVVSERLKNQYQFCFDLITSKPK